jgi:polyisoprenoid-binding protein YceI
MVLVVGGLSGCDRKASEAPPAPPAAATVSAPVAEKPANALRFRVMPRAETAVVSFTFPEPLSDYKGEAKEVGGELTIAESMDAATLRGFIEVKTASVTLGESGIDENAHSAMFMNVEKYPVSRFTITSVEAAEGASLLGAEKVDVKMHGDFSLKGHTIPIVVPTTLAVRRAAYGGVGAITLGASWEINILKPFEIPGPSTGEAAERVVFKADLVVEPGQQSGPPR